MQTLPAVIHCSSPGRRVAPHRVHGLGFATILVVAAGLGTAVGTGNNMVIGGLVAGVCFVGFALYPAAALFCLALAILFLNRWVSLGYLPHAIIWMPDLVLAALAMRFLAMRASRRTAFTARRSVLWALALLGALCTVSVVLNHSSIVEDFIGLRSYFRWPLIFLLTVMVGVSSRTMKRLLVLIVGMALVQVPVTAFQFLQNGGIHNFNSGTLVLSGTAEVFMMTMFSMALLVAFAIHGRKPVIWGALAMAMFLPPLFGSVRAAVFIAPAFFALLLVCALASKRHSRTASAVKVGAFAVVCAAVFFVWATPQSTIVGDNLRSIAAIGGVIAGESVGGSTTRAGRITAVREASALISQSTTTRLVGFGPGSTSVSALVSGQLNYTGGFDPRRSQVSATLVELGYAGPLVLLAVFAALWFTLPRLSDDAEWFWSAVGWAAPMVVLFAALMLPYTAEWTNVSAAPFLLWMIVAAPFVRQRETQFADRKGLNHCETHDAPAHAQNSER